jgi:uncharacterized membrane protein YccC
MLLDRTKRADRYLEWKVRLFVVAAVFALAGIYTENRWLTGVAIALLLAGFLLRFLPSDTEEQDAPDGD